MVCSHGSVGGKRSELVAKKRGKKEETHLPQQPLLPACLPELASDSSDGHGCASVVCEAEVEEVGRDAVFDFCSTARTTAGAREGGM